ncbi:MAG: phosphate ABC transporter permease PstA [Synechococcaceae cyanobacterium SM2_3_1]|nr:phosphate ABC transporter permease PstA [Synechococcaceae cyanobacterium SM2_3_1]
MLKKQPRSFRALVDRGLTLLASLALILTLAPLVLVLIYVLIKGWGRLNLDLLTQLPPPPGYRDGGLANALLGTLIVVGLAAAMALPVGILAAVYLSEFSRSQTLSRWIRFATNILSGVPSIIIGVFVYGLLVRTQITGYSALAGAVALAILMLPTVIRTTDEALQLVPQDLRWASLGSGASDSQTIVRVVLPAAAPAIATGSTLAIARAAGETAPLIFTALFSLYWPGRLFEPMATLSVLIYNFATMPFQPQQELAWAGALILVMLVLLSSLLARWVTHNRMA